MAASKLLAVDPTPLSSLPASQSSLKDYHRFVAAQGLRIVEDQDCYWVEKSRHFWESAPSHRRVRLSPVIARKLFALGALAIRYTCPDGEGTQTCEYIWDDKNYGLEALDKDARRRVRKYAADCTFRPIDFELLIREGRAINLDVYARQNRKPDFQTDPLQWKTYMETCAGLPFVEAYGLFHEDRLCAYSMVLFVDDYCYAFHPYAHSEYLKLSTMNVLMFSLVQRMLQRPGVRRVCYGVESYTPRPTLERFKVAMGCRKSVLYRQIVVHPLFRPAVTSSGAWLAEKALRLFKPSLAQDFSVFARAVRGVPTAEKVDPSDAKRPDELG